LSDFDFSIANLETPVYDHLSINDTKRKTGGWIHFTTEEVLTTVLSELKIRAVSIANNHIFDCLENGYYKTIQHLNKLGIQYSGIDIFDRPFQPVLIETNQKKVALLSYVHKIPILQ